MIRRYVPYIAITLATVSVCLSGVTFYLLDRQDSKINTNRSEQTSASCRERNEERKLLRDQVMVPLRDYFADQLNISEKVPEAAIEQFGVTKAEGLATLTMIVTGLEDAIVSFSPLNCEGRVADIKNTLD